MMKYISCLKKFFSILILFFVIVFSKEIYAHKVMLDIEYDACGPLFGDDGIDETWYLLNDSESFRHISHDVTTIKYYFESYSSDGKYTWTTDVTEELAEEIKNAYVNSMKKWNNVYFYSYDSNGYVVKSKIIDVVEGTKEDHNLTIYPNCYENLGSTGAQTTPSGIGYQYIETGIMNHVHHSNWFMNINLQCFYDYDLFSSEIINYSREVMGAHELGHMLGLKDVDHYCTSNTENHHEEILMGYGNVSNRAQNITYKDIAGVAILRGFHADSNHKWLNVGLQTDNTYKLICSVCNGVKYVTSLSEYQYNQYGFCNGNHNLSGNNMMAVASYANKDYYKCKYCRYVASFSLLVEQNYSYQSQDYSNHVVYNNVSGLAYYVIENHSSSISCDKCTFSHSHNYNVSYLWKDATNHLAFCECDDYKIQGHAVLKGSSICIKCGGKANAGFITPNSSSLTTIKFSINGSYILPNGIIVLVEKDLSAYLNGTLEFYDKHYILV